MKLSQFNFFLDNNNKELQISYQQPLIAITMKMIKLRPKMILFPRMKNEHIRPSPLTMQGGKSNLLTEKTVNSISAV